jgi:Mg2+/Co2+ transporter CorC
LLIFAVLTAIVIGVLSIFVAVLEASVRFHGESSHKAEALAFLRVPLIGIFGVVLGQALAPTGLHWVLAAVIASLLMFTLVAASQFASRTLGHQKIGATLLRLANPLVDWFWASFAPISLPKPEQPEEFEQELHESVEEFTETIVREVMVPRIDMATVSAEATLSSALGVFLNRGYSRLPVVGKTIDDIRGVLYVKDVARLQHESPNKVAVLAAADLARSAIFVPEFKPVDDLLRDMQASATHIAIIVDEYGGVAGLVTMEDLIEEIVGEIADEYDRESASVTEISPSEYMVTARYSLFDLGELFELELEDEDVDSVGGLLTKHLGRLAEVGDSVEVSGLTLTAERIEARRKRLISIRVARNSDLADVQAALNEKD